MKQKEKIMIWYFFMHIHVHTCFVTKSSPLSCPHFLDMDFSVCFFSIGDLMIG